MGRGNNRWYELAVKPTLECFFGGVPALKKAVASPSIPTWNQIAMFLESMRRLRDSAGSAA
jgi:hypothetical protein